MDWNKLRIFYVVTQAGSFTNASKPLNLSQSAVSRQISSLENDLQVPLFHRHARGLLLTEQGETLFETVQEMVTKLLHSQSLLKNSKEQAAGRLRITTTTGFGGCWLIPRMHVFTKKHPEIDICLILEDDDLDLAMREADVAIRMHPPEQPELIQRHLTDFSLPVFASPDYIRQYGKPESFDELFQHRLVVFSEQHPSVKDINWLAEKAKIRCKTHPVSYLEINNMATMAMAIASGLGIGSIPSYTAHHYPDLVPILPHVETPKIEAYFVYPEELRHSKRITVFRNFITSELHIH